MGDASAILLANRNAVQKYAAFLSNEAEVKKNIACSWAGPIRYPNKNHVAFLSRGVAQKTSFEEKVVPDVRIKKAQVKEGECYDSDGVEHPSTIRFYLDGGTPPSDIREVPGEEKGYMVVDKGTTTVIYEDSPKCGYDKVRIHYVGPARGIAATYSKEGFTNGPEDEVLDEERHTYHAVTYQGDTLQLPDMRAAVRSGSCFPKPTGAKWGPLSWEVANHGRGDACDDDDGGEEEEMPSMM